MISTNEKLDFIKYNVFTLLYTNQWLSSDFMLRTYFHFQDETCEIVIFRLYFQVIFRLNENAIEYVPWHFNVLILSEFDFEIKLKT